MQKTALLILVLTLTACAVPSSGVVQRGDDMYTVAHQGDSAWVSTDSLKAAATQEANAFCVGKGKQLKVVYSKEIPAGALGRWPESEVLFKCE